MTTSTASNIQNATKLDLLWLELTARCNLHCLHCYADSHPGLPLDTGMNCSEWSRVISDAHTLGCESIQFIGGEVLLVPYLRDLILHARRIGIGSIEVFSNATLLDNDTIDFFEDHSVRVATSFYCHDAEIHDRITNRSGSWRKTLLSIDRLQQRGLEFRVGIIEMDANRPYITETVAFLQERGIASVGVDRARAFGRATNLTARPSDLSELCGHCGHRRVCVSASGDIYPCIMSRSVRLGSVYETNLADVLRSSSLASFRQELLVAKNYTQAACMPHCWPNGGCSPHDACRPDK